MLKPVADNQIIHFQHHVVAGNLVENLLGDFYFRRLVFHNHPGGKVASGWEVTGLDWKSGATRHRSILGKNNRANGAYAIIQYLANGDLLFNSVAGPIRVKY